MNSVANEALRYPNFRLFLAMKLGVTIAIQIQVIIVSWQLYDITRDPLSLGILGLTEAVPSILVSLYAGHLADMRNRRPIIQACILVLVACSSFLLYFASPRGAWVFSGGGLPIYAVIFLSGIARGFLWPAIFSFMPQLIDRKAYQNAITWNTAAQVNSAVAGPMIGGWVYAHFGAMGGYILDLTFLFFGLAMISFVPNLAAPPATGELGVAEKIKSGLRFVFSQQIILGAISLDLFAVLFGGAVALLPVFADKILSVGPEGLGMMRAAPAAGSLLMTLWLTRYPVKRNIGRVLFLCIAGFGCSIIGFGLSAFFWLSMACLFFSGMFDSVSMVIRSTLIHTLTPENMKGRVAAINNIFVGSSNEIGAFESGLAARYMGTVPSVVFGGAMTLLVVASVSWTNPALRKFNKID